MLPRARSFGTCEPALAGSALVEHLDGFAPHATQLTDLCVKSPDNGLKSPAFGLTGSTSAVGGVQRINDLVQGETQALQGPS